MTKQTIEQLLEEFPDDVDIDEFVARLSLIERLEAGEARLALGHGVTHEAAKRRMERWLS